MSDRWAATGRFDADVLPFVPGFSGRHDGIGEALQRAFAPPAGFAPTPPGFGPGFGKEPPRAAPQADGPRHFHPADRDTNPTEGWSPFDAQPADQFIDPVEAARAEGYAEGLREAREAASNGADRDRALLERLSNALSEAAWLDRERIAQQLRQTVMTLVTGLVGEVGINADLLAARVTAATDLLADSAESAMLRLHPDDVALVQGRLPATIFPVADAAVARGAFVLEAASTIVEDGPERWLDQLATAIDRVPLPSC